MLAIIKNNIRLLLAKKGLLISLLVAPVLLMAFGLSQNTEANLSLKLGIEDHDQTAISMDLLEEIKSKGHERVALDDHPELMVVDQKIDVLMEIPPGFEESLLAGDVPKVLLSSLKGQEVTAIIETPMNLYLRSLAQLIRIDELTSGQDAVTGIERLREEGLDLSVVKPEAQIDRGLELGGKFLFYMLSVNMLLVGRLILSDKAGNTLDRLRRTPVTRTAYLLANFFTGVFFLLCNLITISLLTRFVFHINLNIGLYLVWLIYGMVWIMIGIFMALAARSRRIHGNLVTIITVIAAMIGGSFWPLELAPNLMQKAAQITPHYWAGQWFSSIQQGAGTFERPQFLLALLAFFLIFFALCLFSLVRKQKNETFV